MARKKRSLEEFIEESYKYDVYFTKAFKRIKRTITITSVSLFLLGIASFGLGTYYTKKKIADALEGIRYEIIHDSEKISTELKKHYQKKIEEKLNDPLYEKRIINKILKRKFQEITKLYFNQPRHSLNYYLEQSPQKYWDDGFIFTLNSPKDIYQFSQEATGDPYLWQYFLLYHAPQQDDNDKIRKNPFITLQPKQKIYVPYPFLNQEYKREYEKRVKK